MAAAIAHLSWVVPSTYPSCLSKSNPTLLSPPHRRMIVKMGLQDLSYWSAIDSNIEAHLKKSIPIRPPVSVFEPMHHLTFAAPKTTAPSLCIAACELVGGSPDDALSAASALRLMHAAIFTHQHLPLTDRPNPEPTIEHAFAPNIELLIPDGILPFGFELLGRSAQNHPDRVLRVIIEISRAVGPQGMVDGVYQEMTLSQEEGSEEEMKMIEYVCEKKEGELHGCAGACGGILGGGSEEEIEKLRKFGLYVGMIQGMLYGVGKKITEGRKQVVDKLRGMALKELEIFSGRDVELISTLVHHPVI